MTFVDGLDIGSERKREVKNDAKIWANGKKKRPSTEIKTVWKGEFPREGWVKMTVGWQGQSSVQKEMIN